MPKSILDFAEVPMPFERPTLPDPNAALRELKALIKSMDRQLLGLSKQKAVYTFHKPLVRSPKRRVFASEEERRQYKLDYGRNYYHQNKKRLNQYRAVWRKNNQEHARATQRAWYADPINKVKAKMWKQICEEKKRIAN